MSALLNEPLRPTKPKEAAPEILSYRRALYERETLMLPDEPWNPAARLAQVRASLRALVDAAWPRRHSLPPTDRVCP